jgi:superfamily I DNA/RNA helicase
MRYRLESLLGKQLAGSIGHLGTFHAMAVRCKAHLSLHAFHLDFADIIISWKKVLRRHGRSIGVPNNFVIADTDAWCDNSVPFSGSEIFLTDTHFRSLAILKKLIRKQSERLKEKNFTLKPGDVMSMISKAKAAGTSPEGYARDADQANSDIKRIVADIFRCGLKTYQGRRVSLLTSGLPGIIRKSWNERRV